MHLRLARSLDTKASSTKSPHNAHTQRLGLNVHAKAFVCPLFVWRSKSPRTKTSSTRRPPPQKPTQRLHNDGTVLHAKAFVCPLSVWRSKSPHTKASSTQRPLFKTGPYAKRALDQNHACKDHVYNITCAIPTKASFQNGPLRKKGPWPRLYVQRSCDQDHLCNIYLSMSSPSQCHLHVGTYVRSFDYVVCDSATRVNGTHLPMSTLMALLLCPRRLARNDLVLILSLLLLGVNWYICIELYISVSKCTYICISLHISVSDSIYTYLIPYICISLHIYLYLIAHIYI